MNISPINSNYANRNSNLIEKTNNNVSFCATGVTLAQQAKQEVKCRRGLFASLGLVLRNLFMSKTKKLEPIIDQLTAEIKSEYENGSDIKIFEAKTKELNKLINENVSSYFRYKVFVSDAMKFLQTNFESQPDCNDKDARFKPFKDDKGNYDKRWNKFMLLVHQASKDAVDVKSPNNRDYYKYNKDIAVAERLMLNNKDGLSDKELCGDTYALGIYGFTDEKPDIVGAIRRYREEMGLDE